MGRKKEQLKEGRKKQLKLGWKKQLKVVRKKEQLKVGRYMSLTETAGDLNSGRLVGWGNYILNEGLISFSLLG